MLTRHALAPALAGEAVVSIDDVVEHLRAWKVDTAQTIESLRSCRQRSDESAKQLESPGAVAEYIDFFTDLFTRVEAELGRLVAGVPLGLQRAHLDSMRQIASNGAAEQRRCLMFRDKWINRPLPYEQVRPLLEQISKLTRDQLEDYRELNAASTRLEALTHTAPKPEDPGRALDRRALFTRWFGR